MIVIVYWIQFVLFWLMAGLAFGAYRRWMKFSNKFFRLGCAVIDDASFNSNAWRVLREELDEEPVA